MAMDEDGTGEQSPVNSQHHNANDSGLRIDPSAYALGAVFGSVAFPPDMPDYLKQAILDRADRDRAAAGDMLIDNRMNPDDPRHRQAKADDGDDDNLSQMAQIVQQREEREREEWARTNSTVAGVTMTGAEWAQLADRLRNDDDLRQRIIDTFRKRGMNEIEAEARLERAAEVSEIAAIPPSQRSEDQKRTVANAEADPTFKTDMQTVKSAMDDTAAPRSMVNSSFASAARGEAPSSAPPPTTASPPVATVAGPGF